MVREKAYYAFERSILLAERRMRTPERARSSKTEPRGGAQPERAGSEREAKANLSFVAFDLLHMIMYRI